MAAGAGGKELINKLLDDIAPSLFTKKKDSIDTFDSCFFKGKDKQPRWDKATVELLMYGGGKWSQGLLHACGQTSWKSSKLKLSASKALVLLAKLCDPVHNEDAKMYQAVVKAAKPDIVKAMAMDRHRTGGVDRGTVVAYSIVSDVLAGVPIKVHEKAGIGISAPVAVTTPPVAAAAAAGAGAAAAAPAGDNKDQKKRPPAEVTQKQNLASVAGEQVGSVQLSGAVGPKPDLKKSKSIREILLGFFGRRPTQQVLEAKGIMKKALVFGLSLEALEKSGRVTNGVPTVLRKCMDFMRPEIVKLQGLFRISGDALEIQHLKKAFDYGDDVDLSKSSPHSISGLCKLYLRELPTPLLTFEKYEPMIAAFRAGDMAKLKSLAYDIPAVNRSTLTFLLEFLARVNCFEAVNMMSDNNLAIVFAPNIFRPKVETYENIAKDTPAVIGSIRTLIADVRKAKIAADPDFAKDAPPMPSKEDQSKAGAAAAMAGGATPAPMLRLGSMTGAALAGPLSALSPKNADAKTPSHAASPRHSATTPTSSAPVAIPAKKPHKSADLTGSSADGKAAAAAAPAVGSVDGAAKLQAASMPLPHSPAAGLVLTVGAATGASSSAPALSFVPKPPTTPKPETGAGSYASSVGSTTSVPAPTVSVLLTNDSIAQRLSVAEAEKRPDLDAADFTPWFAYTDPTSGDVYFVNRQTTESVWEKPQSLHEFEALRAYYRSKRGDSPASADGAAAAAATAASPRAANGLTIIREDEPANAAAAAPTPATPATPKPVDAATPATPSTPTAGTAAAAGAASPATGTAAAGGAAGTTAAAAATAAGAKKPVWKRYVDKKSGKYYYVHIATKATTWDKPMDYKDEQAIVAAHQAATAAAAGTSAPTTPTAASTGGSGNSGTAPSTPTAASSVPAPGAASGTAPATPIAAAGGKKEKPPLPALPARLSKQPSVGSLDAIKGSGTLTGTAPTTPTSGPAGTPASGWGTLTVPLPPPADQLPPTPVAGASSDPAVPECDWKEYLDSESGRTYFFNDYTGDTQWEKPKELLEWEKKYGAKATAAPAATPSAAAGASASASASAGGAAGTGAAPASGGSNSPVITVTPAVAVTPTAAVGDAAAAADKPASPAAGASTLSPTSAAAGGSAFNFAGATSRSRPLSVYEKTKLGLLPAAAPAPAANGADAAAGGAAAAADPLADPEKWKTYTDPSTSLLYYVHDSGTTQWEKPNALIERDKANATKAKASATLNPAAATGRAEKRTLSVMERENMSAKGLPAGVPSAAGGSPNAGPSAAASGGPKLAPAGAKTAGLPPGWVEFRDKATGRAYFYNKTTKATTWEKPNA